MKSVWRSRRSWKGRDAWRGLASEFRPTLKLAGPVVLAELGWMAMGVADVIMVGRLGPAAIGAAGLGNVLYFTVAIIGYGLLLGLDTLISQAYGARKLDDCHRSLVDGVYLTLVAGPAMMALVVIGSAATGGWGIAPSVEQRLVPYLLALNWGTLPLLLFTAFRRYLQAMELVGISLFAILSANVLNVAGNWILVYGHLGSPALGVVGSGWATCLARVWMAVVLIVYAFWHSRRYGTGMTKVSLRPDWSRMSHLLGLGLPAAFQLFLEVSVFALAATLAARLGPTSLAAHEVVLHAAATTFMVPLGVSAAAAVRVGQALGRHDPDGARRAGSMALLLGGAFMACAGLTFLTAPRTILGTFTAEPSVIATARSLLIAAAVFQLFDGLQIVATGALRGAGETRLPMYCHLTAYWVFGLPVGYFLAFRSGWGVLGLWVGLTTGLVLLGIALLAGWIHKSRSFGSVAVHAEPPIPMPLGNGHRLVHECEPISE